MWKKTRTVHSSVVVFMRGENEASKGKFLYLILSLARHRNRRPASLGFLPPNRPRRPHGTSESRRTLSRRPLDAHRRRRFWHRTCWRDRRSDDNRRIRRLVDFNPRRCAKQTGQHEQCSPRRWAEFSEDTPPRQVADETRWEAPGVVSRCHWIVSMNPHVLLAPINSCYVK